jgi:hypothetical protein
MVGARSSAHDRHVPRLLVLWARPYHLTAEEAERWARTAVRGLLADDAVSSAALTRLERPSPRHSGDWHWLLELDTTQPAGDCVTRDPCAEWLADLQLLGMRPAVMLVADAVALEPEDA